MVDESLPETEAPTDDEPLAEEEPVDTRVPRDDEESEDG